MHITSLPGEFGVGDLGPAAHDFVDFLAEAGQRYWQFLPVGPVDQVFSWSPYMSLASLAGNPLLISPDLLLQEGLLEGDDIIENPPFSEYHIDFKIVEEYKKHLLQKAYSRLSNSSCFEDYEQFCAKEEWLDGYALFMSIRGYLGGVSWNKWPAGLAKCEHSAVTKLRKKLAERIGFYKFEQFCFFKQWHALRSYANSKGVKLIGDLPIYVSFDSVDVWENQQCFCLDNNTFEPTSVAGVPPDYFSETGQRWGNPLYRWKVGRKKNDSLTLWWKKRFLQIARFVDVVRIDHFRAFEAYWQIPAKEETAVNGRWVKGPGKPFFDEMKDVLAGLDIIAEDLGVITPQVEKLRDDLGFPGMKILQFAFDSDCNNLYLPHNYSDKNCLVYTGTHDNNTTLGWYMDPSASEESKNNVKRYANSGGQQIHWDFIRLAFSSVAATAIIPMQDLLGFGGDCRMNFPGTVEGNWVWRCAERFISHEVGKKLLKETQFYGRFQA